MCEDAIAERAHSQSKDLHMQRKVVKSLMEQIAPGTRVKRGPDWKWAAQDGDPPGVCVCKYVM